MQESAVERRHPIRFIIEVVGVVFVYAKQIFFVFGCSGKGASGFRIVDVCADFLLRGVRIEHSVDEQRIAQLIETEAAARSFDGFAAFAVTVDDAAHTFGGNAFGVVAHFDEDEFAVSAILLVHVEDGVGGGAGTGEGVEDDRIRIGSDLENSFN